MLCLQQRDKNIRWEKVSSTNGDGKHGTAMLKNETDSFSLHHTQKQTQMTKELNVRPETIRHTEGHGGKYTP